MDRSQGSQNNAQNSLQTRLLNAVVCNDVNILSAVINDNPGGDYQKSIFKIESTKGQEQGVRMSIPIENLTLLHIAAFYDSLEVFVFLENLGFPLNIKSAAQYSPIHYACLNGSNEVCTYILMKDPAEAKMLPEVEVLFYFSLSSYLSSYNIWKLSDLKASFRLWC